MIEIDVMVEEIPEDTRMRLPGKYVVKKGLIDPEDISAILPHRAVNMSRTSDIAECCTVLVQGYPILALGNVEAMSKRLRRGY